MTDQNLIQELIKRNLLTEDAGKRVMKDAEFSERAVEEILYAQRLVNEEELAKVKSELLGAPYKKINVAGIANDLFVLIPKDTAVNYRVMPIERTREMLVIGMLRPDDTRAQEALRFIAKQQGISLGVYLVTPSDLAAAWRRYAPYGSEVAAAVKEIGDIKQEEDIVGLEEGGSAQDAPIIKIVASTLRQAVEAGASDIHIEPQRSRLRIRFRIDGQLQEVVSLPVTLSQQIASRIKVLARLKLDETRVPQDGRFRTVLFGRDIDYRVSSFPTPSGEKVAIRVLDPTTGLKSFDQLGFNPYNRKILETALTRPYGMVLISGPTGSGKTTTLYAIMQHLNTDGVNIVSLEDPVEYFVDGLNQSQVHPEIGYDFSSGLRQILRQDPDVIMVGEIRDGETAGLAVNAALTGHIMLSTIHTNNAVGVIPRLIDLGVPPFLLSSALNCMIAQRLVLKLCPECRHEEVATPEMQRLIGATLDELPQEVRLAVHYKTPYKVYRAIPKQTCKICKGKGTAGRIGMVEIFQMSRELGDLVSKGFTEGKLWDEAKRQGMLSLRGDGILKALDGIISLEEVVRETVL